MDFSGHVASSQSTAGQHVIADFVCEGAGRGCMVTAVAGIPRPSAACRRKELLSFRMESLNRIRALDPSRVIASIAMKLGTF